MTRDDWTEPYWRQAPLQALGSDPWPEGRLDLAIVGAGLTGLVAGLAAADLGLRVAVFELRFPGGGASSRNAGYITPGTPLGYERCAATLGVPRATALWQQSIAAASEAAGFIDGTGIDCGLVRTGRVTLAVSKRHADAQRRRADAERQRFGWPLQAVAANDLGRYTGLPGYHGALVDPWTWGLDPARLVTGLVGRLRAAGGRVVWPAKVDAIEGTGPRATQAVLRIGKRTVNARQGLLALDGNAESIASPWSRRVFSVGSALLVTEPLPTATTRALSVTGAALETSETFKRYVRILDDGRLLIGARNSLLAPERRGLAREHLVARSDAWLAPCAGPLAISHAWTGTLGFTMNLLPILARQGRFVFAGGYCGHGIPTAVALGRQAGRWAAGRGLPDTAVHTIDHPVTPPRSLHQSLLAAATWAVRCRDWMALRGMA